MENTNIPFLLIGLIILGAVTTDSYIGNLPHAVWNIFLLSRGALVGAEYTLGLIVLLCAFLLKPYQNILKVIAALIFLYDTISMIWMGQNTGYENTHLYFIPPIGLICIIYGLKGHAGWKETLQAILNWLKATPDY